MVLSIAESLVSPSCSGCHWKWGLLHSTGFQNKQAWRLSHWEGDMQISPATSYTELKVMPTLKTAGFAQPWAIPSPWQTGLLTHSPGRQVANLHASVDHLTPCAQDPSLILIKSGIITIILFCLCNQQKSSEHHFRHKQVKNKHLQSAFWTLKTLHMHQLISPYNNPGHHNQHCVARVELRRWPLA